MTATAPHLPQNLEAEENVLGSLMLSEAAVDRVIAAGLTADDFYRESHARIFRAILSLHQLGFPVDVLTVIDRLEESGQLEATGGKDRIREIATIVPTATNVVHHANLVSKRARLRRAATAAQAIQEHALAGGDPDHIESELLELARTITDTQTTSKPFRVTPLSDFLDQQEEIAEAIIGEPGETLVPAGGLLILGGEGGASKTTLTLDAVAHMAAGIPWIGYTPIRPVRILLIENEGPRPQFRAKLQQKVKTWEHTPFMQNVVIWEEPWAAFSFANPADRRNLRKTAAENAVDLVVADPLDSLGISGGGTPDDVRTFIQWLRECGLHNPDHPLAFWILHHFNKQAGGSIVSRLSGAWGGHPDTVLGLELADGQASKLTWGKLRHATPPAKNTTMLAWRLETRGFDVIDTGVANIDTDTLERTILKHVADHPGQTKDQVGDKLKDPWSRTQIRAGIDRLIETDQLETRRGLSPSGKYLHIPDLAPAANSPYSRPLFEDPAEIQLAENTPRVEVENTPDLALQANSRPASTPTRELGAHPSERATRDSPSVPVGDGESVELASWVTDPAPPTTDRLHEQRAWLDAGGWMAADLDQALLEHFPMLSPADLPALHAHAAQIEAAEFGGAT